MFASIFVPLQNEKYFDFCGALGWLSSTFISLYYPTLKARLVEGKLIPFSPPSSFGPRQLLLSGALSLWSLRLGSFLTMVYSLTLELNTALIPVVSFPEGGQSGR